MRRLAGVVIGLFLVVLNAPLSAGAQGCYPPPCDAEAPGTTPVAGSPVADGFVVGTDNAAAAATTVAATDGPLPFVFAGLLLIGTTLGVVVIGRRAAIAREQGEHGAQRSGTAPSLTPRREPSRSFV